MPRSEPFAPLGPKSDAVTGARELLQGKARRQRRQFLVEGPDAVAAALAAGWLRDLYTDALEDSLAVAAKAAGARVYFVDSRAIAALSDTVSPQGPIGVAAMPEPDESDLGSARLVVVCDAISDPGNLGTVIRTAAAAGADAVIATAGSADFWSGKTVRATAAAFASVPLLQLASRSDVAALLTKHGIQILVTSADGSLAWGSEALAATLRKPHAWVIGSEAHGVSADFRKIANAAVTIPMAPGVESLNAAIAAALCIYESVRANRHF